jgi:hypothetical protein
VLSSRAIFDLLEYGDMSDSIAVVVGVAIRLSTGVQYYYLRFSISITYHVHVAFPILYHTVTDTYSLDTSIKSGSVPYIALFALSCRSFISHRSCR